VNIFYVSIRTTENYQFDKFRSAGVTGKAIINRATILYVQPEMKFRSPPGHFHHEPPLLMGFQTKLGLFKSALERKDFKYFSIFLQLEKDGSIVDSVLKIHCVPVFPNVLGLRHLGGEKYGLRRPSAKPQQCSLVYSVMTF